MGDLPLDAQRPVEEVRRPGLRPHHGPLVRDAVPQDVRRRGHRRCSHPRMANRAASPRTRARSTRRLAYRSCSIHRISNGGSSRFRLRSSCPTRRTGRSSAGTRRAGGFAGHGGGKPASRRGGKPSCSDLARHPLLGQGPRHPQPDRPHRSQPGRCLPRQRDRRRRPQLVGHRRRHGERPQHGLRREGRSRAVLARGARHAPGRDRRLRVRLLGHPP